MNTRVLIAERDPVLCDCYDQFLTSHGCRVATVSNAVDCLKMFRQFLPEIIVLEWEMLCGGGEGVVAAIRDEFPLLPLEVVILTVDAEKFHLRDKATIHRAACLEKPFSLSDLLRVIRQCESSPLTETN